MTTSVVFVRRLETGMLSVLLYCELIVDLNLSSLCCNLRGDPDLRLHVAEVTFSHVCQVYVRELQFAL